MDTHRSHLQDLYDHSVYGSGKMIEGGWELFEVEVCLPHSSLGARVVCMAPNTVLLVE